MTDSGLAISQNEFSVESFQQQYDVSIVDPTGTVNLGSYLTKSGIQQIQYEAKLALTFLNDSSDRFDDLFLKKVLT